jgi:CRP/FNR family transcriptional regulator, cyclic AMP receptor protein
MVSPELIRRYPFFAGLSYEWIERVARAGDESTVPVDHRFFREGDALDRFYLVLEGAVAIVMEVPDREQTQTVSSQLTGVIAGRDVTVSTVGTGEVFGWSALLPPTDATAGAKAITPCHVVAFDAPALESTFEDDWRFGYVLTQKMAGVLRDRLRDVRIETLYLSP